ncbi:hypothetical protein FK216_12320, partial [Moraxellaceae bacterium AER2_44_116]
MMRRPPFQVNPLALSVALILTVPMPVLAQDVFTSPFNNSTTITEQVVVPAPTGTITVNNTTTDVQITSTVSGVGGLVKKGVGTLTLTADNAYVGGTSIQEGTLAISGDKSLGSTDKTLGINTGNVAISNGATLQTNSDVTLSVDRILTITGSATGETINTAGHNSEINGQITGTGKLIKKGDGSLTVSNQTLTTANTPNNYTGGTLIDGGTLIIDKDSDLGAVSGTLEIRSGALQVNNSIDIQRKVTTTSISGGGINTAGNDVTLSGLVSGGSPLVKLGAGTLTLKDATNTQSETAVLGGKVSIANSRALGTAAGKLTLDGGTLQTTGSLNIEDKAAGGKDIHIGDGGGTLETVGSSNTLEIKGSIVKAGSGLSDSTGEIGTGSGTGAGTGGLTKTGAGTLILSGAGNSYGGSTTVQDGKLIVNNLKNIGGATAKLILDGGDVKFTGAVSLSSLTLNGEGGTFDTSANSSTISAVTGSGGLRKAGNGTLNVTGSNTYTGDTTISEGKLQITSDAALGVANTNNVLGSLVLDGGTLQTTGALNSARGVTITSANGTIDTTSQTDTLSGSISGLGQLVKTGSGVLKLTGTNNTFQGGVRVKEGTLEVSTNEALGSIDGKIEIDGATLAITGATTANASNTLNRAVSLTSHGGTLSVSTGDATLSGEIKADVGLKPSLIKSGAGNLNLTGANSLFEGDIFVKEGSLGISEQGNLGKGQLTLDGGNVRINNDLGISQKIVINSQGGGIDTNNHTASVSGVMSGAGTFVKMGLGTLELKSPNTYSGGTLIKQGTLAIDDSNNLGALGKTITLNGGDLQLAKDIDFGTLGEGGDGGRTIVVDVAGGGIDTNGHDSKIGTVLSGSGIFVKKGEGNLTLNQVGSNLLTAGITVKQGSLSIGSDGSLGTSNAILTLDGGELRSTATLESGRNIQLNSHGALNTLGNILTLNGVIGGVGGLSLTKEKDDPIGHLVLNGDNTYTGGTTIDAGEVTVSKNKSFGAGSVIFADKTTLKTSAAVSLSNQLQLAGSITIESAKDNDSILSGVVSGVGGLNKDGVGSLTLNGVNTYTGDTVISAGKVIVNNNQSLGLGNTLVLKTGVGLETSAAVTLSNQLRLDGDANIHVKANNSILNGVISGTGGLSKDGTGSLTLSGVNTYKGNTVISAGKVVVNNGQAFGEGASLTLNADTTLETSSAIALSQKVLLVSGNATVNTIANDSALNGDVSGDGGLTKEGVGQLVLSGNNTYKGNTNINAGMLAISQDSNLGDVSNSLILNGGALQTLADLTISRDLTISASQGGIDTAGHNTVMTGVISGGTDASQLIKSGTGSLTLTNENNSYVGTAVTGGTLIIEKDNQLGKTGNIFLNGGALEITANVASSRNLQLGNNNGTLNTQDNGLSLSGLISGSGGLI